MKYASALPFTDEERQESDNWRAEMVRKGFARKRAAPLGDYSRQGTPETRALALRILGEHDDQR